MCTNFTLKTTKNQVVNGRSMEFGTNLGSQFFFRKSGHDYKGILNEFGAEYSWIGKYSFVCMNASHLPFGKPLATDGINTQGLSTGSLWLPGSEYQKITDKKKELPVELFCNWVLSQFATCEDVKQAVLSGEVQVKGLTLGKGQLMPGHFPYANQNDIRFVADSWESPTIGVWGRGWEVWLNGLEVTQFTYLQQAGGYTLDPVPVQITYGLERLVLALQNVQTLWEIEYSNGLSYEDLLLEPEVEQCKYYFDVADVAHLKALYQLYLRESNGCFEAGLLYPAYDYCLKLAHIFNILDARGIVGVAERAKFSRQMRRQYQRIAEKYLKQREALNFPLLDVEEPSHFPSLVTPSQSVDRNGKQAFLLEIGTEEMPVKAFESALRQLRTKVPLFLDELGFEYGRVEVDGTPRRISINVHFLTGQQVNYVDKPQLTVPTLAEHLPKLIADIHFNRSMRWNHTNVFFTRPIRWIVALFGQDLIPFSFADVQSGRTSRGIRPDSSPEIRIADAYTYAGVLRKNGVSHVADKRIKQIEKVSSKLAAEKKGILLNSPELMDEVSNMVERPTPLRGQFDEAFLSLPTEILVAVMINRQRYFPVFDENEQLLPYFLSVRNGDEKHLDIVIEGNEKVLNGRFADAQFFYKKDSQYRLEEFVPKLTAVAFHPKLGSMAEKTERLQLLTTFIGKQLSFSEAEIQTAKRAAYLSKADLATQIVQEMKSLQGVMGGYYAMNSGESAPVATAISEQYSLLTTSNTSLLLAISDRIDSIVGLFAAGEVPDEINDPYRLQRMALGLLNHLVKNKVDINLQSCVLEAAKLQTVPCKPPLQNQILDFIQQNLQNMLLEMGFSNEVIQESVNLVGSHNPSRIVEQISKESEEVPSDYQFSK
ncbi:MAG: glycine--tRNA ligase subunit beta [Chloroflexota bacterium]